MPRVRRCWVGSCAFNVEGCFCDNDEIDINQYGACDNFVEREYEPEELEDEE